MEYADEHRPLAGYGALSAAWVAAFGGSLLALRAAGQRPPERFAAADLVLAGIASHKISRMISRDKVTSFVRAPFMRFKGSGGKGEVEEEPQGEGLKLAIGELFNCPYCLDHWVASAYALGLIGAPRTTRLIGFVAATEAIADYLQIAYRAADEHADADSGS